MVSSTSNSERDSLVAIHRGDASYAKTPPFHAGEKYPECPTTGSEANPAYAAVRGVLQLLGLDQARFGTREWNPLGEIIVPGDTVLLKPNLIRESHLLYQDQWEQVITHGSVVRAVL